MIIGLGTDIADMARIRAAHDKFGSRFTQKILTDAEQHHMPADPVPYLAGRFAAKEAAAKALGTGFSQGIGLLHIEVLRTPEGQPQLRFLGPARDRACALGLKCSHLSISHDRSAAVAVVVLEV